MLDDFVFSLRELAFGFHAFFISSSLVNILIIVFYWPSLLFGLGFCYFRHSRHRKLIVASQNFSSSPAIMLDSATSHSGSNLHHLASCVISRGFLPKTKANFNPISLISKLVF